jgi:glycine cleavage system H lipoate-binding protein
MAILLAIATFLVIVLVNYLMQRRADAREAARESTADGVEPALRLEAGTEPVWVAGYRLPAPLHYHLGHTWANVLSSGMVAVGLDDFGQRLFGPALRLQLPSPGDWLKQGVTGFTATANGRSAGLLAPVEGEVVEVNPDVVRNPAVLGTDPYGRGWLFKVRCPGLSANLKNLIHGKLAQRWTEDQSEQLELELMAIKGSVLQDGGRPAVDFADHLDSREWRRLAAHFFRS